MNLDFLSSTVASNTAEDWLVSVAVVVGSVLASRLFYIITTKILKRLFARLKGRLLYILTDMLEEPIAMAIVIVGFLAAQRRLDLAKGIDETFDKVALFALILLVTWAIARLMNDLISQYLVPIIERTQSKLDDQLLPIARKGTTLVVWLLGVIVALDNVGYNVGTIVAGLGIGGLAFAFAAQETIANLFGGVTIFIDAPFKIGDRIKISGFDGWVREIGIRTARLETLDGRRLTMPNSVFSKNVIENVSSEPATRVLQTVGVACDQDAATLERAVEIARKTLADDPDLGEKSTAYFQGFGESSYDVGLVIWINKGADYAGTLSRVNLSLVKGFERGGVALALPMRYVVSAKP
jgi:MscS family membrane protein